MSLSNLNKLVDDESRRQSFVNEERVSNESTTKIFRHQKKKKKTNGKAQ